MLDEGGDAGVPGLGGDAVEADASQGGGGGVPGSQGVSADAFRGDPGCCGAFLEDAGEAAAGERTGADAVVVEAEEELAGLCAAVGEPVVERGNWVGLGVLAVGDADELASGFRVGLGLTDADEQPLGLGLDVREVEAGELGAPQRRREADQDEGGVAGSACGGAVDAGDHAADLLGAQGPGLAPWGGAEGAANAATDGLDRGVRDRVGVAFCLVLGGDRSAGALDGPGSGTGGREVGEVGADGGLGRGHSGDASFGAPAFEPSPLPRVGPAGGRRSPGRDGVSDPGDVLVGEPAGEGLGQAEDPWTRDDSGRGESRVECGNTSGDEGESHALVLPITATGGRRRVADGNV